MSTATFPRDFVENLTRAVEDRDGASERGEIRFRCPNPDHPDEHPSARWSPDKAAWRCDACSAGGGALDLADVLGVEKPTVTGATVQPLADAKRLPVEELRGYGLSDTTRQRVKAVAIPYFGVQPDATVATRYRIAIDGKDCFRWKKGDKLAVYGLWRLEDVRRRGWVLLVEGESDCWTAWHHEIPALGIPGKTLWKSEWAALLEGLDVFIWQEPDAEDFARRTGATLPDARVIAAPPGTKDISEAHIRGDDVADLVARLRPDAPRIADILDQERQARLSELRTDAAPLLSQADPLPLIERGIRALGFGGDIRAACITYLAVTTRLLSQRTGTMPAHLLLIGLASSGKSFTLSVVLRLMPPEAKAEIDAASPRVLIYDTADLRHRALVFAESDSLPAGEDNPAASAVRTLLQEGTVRYKVTIRDPDNGGYTVQTIDRPGPTVLVTTAVKSLGPQLSTRLFTLDVPDDVPQIGAALAAQAELEDAGGADPDEGLIQFQAYLQALAPWEVTVPFARPLAELIGETHLASRVLRDFQRLLSFVKAVAVLRHEQRDHDAKGRLVATLDDYETVRELVNHIYEATVSGGSLAVREAVVAVASLVATGAQPDTQPSALDVAKVLGVHKTTATRRVNKAVTLGWLINHEEKRSKPYRLAIGDPMPEDVGLPTREALEAHGCTVAGVTVGKSEPPASEPTPLRPGTIWLCSGCALPRSGDDRPCPACGGLEGRWFMPKEAAS